MNMSKTIIRKERYATNCTRCRCKLDNIESKLKKSYPCGHAVCIDCFNKLCMDEAGDRNHAAAAAANAARIIPCFRCASAISIKQVKIIYFYSK